MSLLEKRFATGNLVGVSYHFSEVGDILPIHNHAHGGVHITIVSSGSFLVHGPGWEREAKAGEVIDFLPEQDHEFVAREPNSRLVNIQK